jgi:hypothetical protein
MTNNCRIIIAKSIDEIAKFSDLHICTRAMVIFWFYGKLSQSSFLWIGRSENHVSAFLPHRKLKPCSAYGNLVSPCLASQKMEILFLLVLRTENGNPVSPCFRSQKWKPCFTLLSITENGNPVSPCFASQKNGNPVSPCFASQKKQLILFSYRFRLTSRLPRRILFFFSKKKVKGNPAFP